MTEAKFLDKTAAARFLGVPRSWLEYQVRRRAVPVHKRGRRLFFVADELETWVLGQGRSERAQ